MFVFPPVDLADETGLLAVGGDLRVETLLAAYSSGIFPWPVAGFPEIPWFAPPQRCLLYFENLHISRSLRRWLRRQDLRLSMNTAFPEVIRACAEPRRTQAETWINDSIIEAYCELHTLGFAHSLECYRGQELVAGIYGVALGAFFAGESMFHRETNASKLCVLALAEQLQIRGAAWMDCQQSTPLLRGFGAREVPRRVFMQELERALASAPFELPRGAIASVYCRS